MSSFPEDEEECENENENENEREEEEAFRLFECDPSDLLPIIWRGVELLGKG